MSIFANMNFSSKILEEAVMAMSSLPSIGKKTALRLVLHLAGTQTDKTKKIIKALTDLESQLRMCESCFNYSDAPICNICSDAARNKYQICIVASAKDVMAIENTQQFSGVYHVLGGVISPLEGVGPEHLQIASLVERVKTTDVEELIMAVSPSIEGDTTIYYISKLLSDTKVKISTIARGVAFGGELEYADELTLGRSIHGRTDYNKEAII